MRVGGETLARIVTLTNFHPRLTWPQLYHEYSSKLFSLEVRGEAILLAHRKLRSWKPRLGTSCQETQSKLTLFAVDSSVNNSVNQLCTGLHSWSNFRNTYLTVYIAVINSGTKCYLQQKNDKFQNFISLTQFKSKYKNIYSMMHEQTCSEYF